MSTAFFAADPTALSAPSDWTNQLNRFLRFKDPLVEQEFADYRRHKSTLITFRVPLLLGMVIWAAFVTTDLPEAIPLVYRIIMIILRLGVVVVGIVHMTLASCIPKIGARPISDCTFYFVIVMGVQIGLENLFIYDMSRTTTPLGLPLILYGEAGICGFTHIQMLFVGGFQVIVSVVTLYIKYPELPVDQFIPYTFALVATWTLCISTCLDLNMRDRYQFILTRQAAIEAIDWHTFNTPQRMLNNVDFLAYSQSSTNIDTIKAREKDTEEGKKDPETMSQLAAQSLHNGSGKSIMLQKVEENKAYTNTEMKKVRCTLSFAKLRLERGFTAFTIRETWRSLRMVMLLAVLGECVFAVQDFLSLPEAVRTVVALRFGFTVPVLLLAAGATLTTVTKQRAHIIIPLIAFLNGVSKLLVLYLVPFLTQAQQLIFVAAIMRYMVFGAAAYKLRYSVLIVVCTPICVLELVLLLSRGFGYGLLLFPAGALLIAIVIAFVTERHSRVVFLLEIAMQRKSIAGMPLREMTAAGALPPLPLPKLMILEEEEPPLTPHDAWVIENTNGSIPATVSNESVQSASNVKVTGVGSNYALQPETTNAARKSENTSRASSAGDLTTLIKPAHINKVEMR